MDFDILPLSNASTPQTPSPRTSVDLDDVLPVHDLQKPPREFDHHHPPYWNIPNACPPARGSFLSDLYDSHMKLDELADHHRPSNADVYLSPPVLRHDWDVGGSLGASSAESSPSVHHLSPPAELYRRASYPYVRHDHDDGIPPAPAFVSSNPNSLIFASRSDGVYGEPLPLHQDGSTLPLSADPSALQGRPLDEPYLSPHLSLHELDGDGIKMENSGPAIVPSQAYYRPPSSSSLSSGSATPYMTQHGSIPVMHTDDAASKETQYLRRRCFNCHTTEPPSWRRSTLNPGKIVCNKCGLYERTHLRPRPHRFDELRASNKARKAAKSHGGSPTTSPKAANGYVKKEENDYESGIRRGSVSSNGGPSSGHGNDWEDAGGPHYTTTSAPTTAYNSPLTSQYSIPRLSRSPPIHSAGTIRLPNAPLSEISRLSGRTPEKAASTPYYLDGEGSRSSSDYFNRRPSLPVNLDSIRRSESDMPEVTAPKSMVRKVTAS